MSAQVAGRTVRSVSIPHHNASEGRELFLRLGHVVGQGRWTNVAFPGGIRRARCAYIDLHVLVRRLCLRPVVPGIHGTGQGHLRRL